MALILLMNDIQLRKRGRATRLTRHETGFDSNVNVTWFSSILATRSFRAASRGRDPGAPRRAAEELRAREGRDRCQPRSAHSTCGEECWKPFRGGLLRPSATRSEPSVDARRTCLSPFRPRK